MENYVRVASTADRIREAMRLSGKTQADLVRETGIGKSNISRYVSGRFDPKNDTVNKIAIALNVNPVWLWGCDVPMEIPEEQKKEQPNEYNGLSKEKIMLIEYAKNLPEDKVLLALRLLKSVAEVDE